MVIFEIFKKKFLEETQKDIRLLSLEKGTYAPFSYYGCSNNDAMLIFLRSGLDFRKPKLDENLELDLYYYIEQSLQSNCLGLNSAWIDKDGHHYLIFQFLNFINLEAGHTIEGIEESVEVVSVLKNSNVSELDFEDVTSTKKELNLINVLPSLLSLFKPRMTRKFSEKDAVMLSGLAKDTEHLMQLHKYTKATT